MFKKIYNISDQGIICDLGNEINKEISIKTIAIFNYINKISINNLKLGIKNITPSYNKIVIQYDLSKPEGDKDRVGDCSKAKEALGWWPTVPLAEGLEKTYSWISDFLSAN